MEFLKQAHSTYHLRYHLVFVTKYRRKIFSSPGMSAYLLAVFRAVARQYPDIKLFEMRADLDHVHLLASIPPRMAIADAVRLLKTNSAKSMRARFPFLSTMYERRGMGVWSDGYFVSTVGSNERVVERYIRAQGKEDKGQTKFVWS
jgi:putative transposase